MWTWCFRASCTRCSRSTRREVTDVLIEVLGTEFDGVLGCDYFSSYRSYMGEFDVTIQFCLAHLIRDVKFLTTLPDARDRAYGERLREALRELFGVIHRRERFSAKQFQSQLDLARLKILSCAQIDVPATRRSRNLAARLREARRELLPVHYDSGSRADEQPGGASDPLRSDRPTDHARDEE